MGGRIDPDTAARANARMRECAKPYRFNVSAYRRSHRVTPLLRRDGIGAESVHAQAGTTYFPANVTAPIFGIGAVFDAGPRGLVPELRATFESNFGLENRAFETFTYSMAIGPRLGLLDRDSFWLGAEMHLLGSMSRYRRDDQTIRHLAVTWRSGRRKLLRTRSDSMNCGRFNKLTRHWSP